MSNAKTGIRNTAAAVGIVLTLAACGAVAEPPDQAPGAGSLADVPRTETSAVVATTESPTTTVAVTVPDLSEPDESGPTRDCRRSVRMANIHYQLAFFSLCETEADLVPFPVYRKMEQAPSLQEKLTMLVRGSRTYELEDGLISGFDWVEERNQIEVTVDIDAAGIATVDFVIDGQRWNPGSRASASAQYLSFVEPLEATVFSDPAVTGLDRSTLCWGESDCTGVTTRETWEGMMFVNHGILCSPEEMGWDGWGCEISDERTFAATVVGVASDDVLNMRSGPGVAYFIVGALDPDATVEVLEHARQAKDRALWRLVRSDSNEVGWVNASFLVNSVVLAGDRTAAERLVDAFVEFAVRPSDDAFAALPLADEVALGLGSQILKVVTGSTLRSADVWKLDQEYFRAATGPFSALGSLESRGDYQVTVGSHDHCASPPMPLPEGFGHLNQISVQPAEGSIDSCLQWSTVDFFVTADGKVVAITKDFWEP